MTWKELNWFQFERGVFVEEIKGTFSRILKLTEADFRKRKEQRDTGISTEPNNQHLHNELAWSEEKLRREGQILTAMMFTVTFRAVQTVLNEMLYWSTGTNPDLGRLNLLEAEYQKIGTPLIDQREFDIIKEIRLARNSCVHNLNKPDEEYKRDYPRPRWLDETGHISITEKQWDHLVVQLEHWSNDLVKRMSENNARRKQQ